MVHAGTFVCTYMAVLVMFGLLLDQERARVHMPTMATSEIAILLDIQILDNVGLKQGLAIPA